MARLGLLGSGGSGSVSASVRARRSSARVHVNIEVEEKRRHRRFLLEVEMTSLYFLLRTSRESAIVNYSLLVEIDGVFDAIFQW